MEKQERQPTVIRILRVPYGKRRIIYLAPAIGPNTYQAVGQEIINSGFHVLTGDKLAPLVHAAYCSPAKDNRKFRNVRKLVRNGWLWVFNQNIYTDKGMYSLHDGKAQGRSNPLSAKSLEKMLKGGKEHNSIRFSKDGRVAFAPIGSYILGKQTPQSLITQGDVIAQYGLHGAELLGEVAEAIGKPAYTYGVSIQQGDAPEVRVSALNVSDVGLRVNGDFFDSADYNWAFPVAAPQNFLLEKNSTQLQTPAQR